jgi:hypothetical protein
MNYCRFDIARDDERSRSCGLEAAWEIISRFGNASVYRCDEHAGQGLNREVIDRIVPWPPVEPRLPKNTLDVAKAHLDDAKRCLSDTPLGGHFSPPSPKRGG